MAAKDVLKNLRDNDYGPPEEGTSSPETLNRTLHLTDEEQKMFPPGEVTCQLQGRLEEGGRLSVMSLSPGPSPQEADMAGQVASRVMPGLSPS